MRGADPPIEYDLGAGTGPVWTLRELLALEGGSDPAQLLDAPLVYSSAIGSRELREAIASVSGVDPDEVKVVTGAAEALLILFFLAAEPGANVIMPNPAFPSYAALAESLRIEIRRYDLRARDGFRVDPDEIRSLADANTRILLVNSPHNPTGAVLSDRDTETLHDFCADRGIQFVADEVYHPIYHGPAMRSATRLPHATVIGDLSKALCLSGLRVGWIIERNARLREQYMNARSYFTVSNAVLSERLATLALRHHETIYGRVRRVASANLALLDRLFADHGDVLEWVRPAGGMTAFPWFRREKDVREFCRQLTKTGVMLVPGDCFGAPAHFRLGFAASGERFPGAVAQLDKFLRAEARPRASTTYSR